MPVESKTRSGRLLYVLPDVEWFPADSNGFTRGVRFSPAFRDDVGIANGRSNDNYGCSGVIFEAYLLGPHGAVQFKMGTDWQIEDCEFSYPRKSHNFGPSARDLGYHSPVQMYDGQEPISDACEFLPDGGACFYDGSGLNAQKVMARLIREGLPGVWWELEDYYRCVFEAAPSSTDAGGES